LAQNPIDGAFSSEERLPSLLAAGPSHLAAVGACNFKPTLKRFFR